MAPIEIIDRLENAGFEAVIVGGAVRDILLKKTPNDIDIATNARYYQMRKLFPDVKLDEVGKNFQVLMIDGIEVSTYRMDHYDSNGECTGAVPASSLNDDLSRRDLTINAMALKRVKFHAPNLNLIKYIGFTWQLIDPFDGMKDLKKCKIRFVGNPDRRIEEDPVRMLRACRFLATMDIHSCFDEDSFNAIVKCSHLINDIPCERIHVEIIKAMKARNAGNFFRALANTGILQYIFPSMLDTIGHDGGRYHNETIFEHSVTACDEIDCNVPQLKIAAFLHDVGKPKAFLLNCNGSFLKHEIYGVELAKKDLIRLKFHNNEIDYILSIIELHMNHIDVDSSKKQLRKLLVKLDKAGIYFDDFIDMVIADHNANRKHEKHPEAVRQTILNNVIDTINNGKLVGIRDMDINGNDIMKIFDIGPCPKIGEILKFLFDCVIEDPNLNTKENLIDIIYANFDKLKGDL